MKCVSNQGRGWYDGSICLFYYCNAQKIIHNGDKFSLNSELVSLSPRNLLYYGKEKNDKIIKLSNVLSASDSYPVVEVGVWNIKWPEEHDLQRAASGEARILCCWPHVLLGRGGAAPPLRAPPLSADEAPGGPCPLQIFAVRIREEIKFLLIGTKQIITDLPVYSSRLNLKVSNIYQ